LTEDKTVSDISSNTSFDGDEYTIEKKFLSMGGRYHIKDGSRKKVGFCEEQTLKIKGELNIYDGEGKNEELFRIKQENIADFRGLFKVIDKKNEKVIGFLKRRSPESVVLSGWNILDDEKELIGRAAEDSILKNVVRSKGIGKRLPYRYKIHQNGAKVGYCKQRLTIFRDEYRLKIEKDLDPDVDRRLLVSLALLLDSVEGKYRKMKRVLSSF